MMMTAQAIRPRLMGDIEADLPCLKGDQRRIRQVLNLSNALKPRLRRQGLVRVFAQNRVLCCR